MKTLLAACVVCAIAIASYVVVLRGESASYEHSLELYRAAQHMWDEKRYGEAKKGYEAYRAWARQGHPNAWLDRDVTIMMARCVWRAGDPGAALTLFDEALAAKVSMDLTCERALCQAEIDAEAALAWLRQCSLDQPFSSLAIARFYKERREWGRAIELLQPMLAEIEASKSDSINTLAMLQTISVEQLARLSLAQAVLEPLAECLVALGHMDAARLIAQRGIHVGRRVLIATNSKPYEVEAGSVVCRVVLAQLEARARNWVEASRNLALAGLMGGRSGRLCDVIEQLEKSVQSNLGNK